MRKTPPQGLLVSPPAVVLFDLGGVVVDVDLERSRQLWARVPGLDAATFDVAFFESGLKARMDRDPLDLEDLELLVNRTAGSRLRGEEIEAIWNACIVPRLDVIGLVRRVAESARLGVLSDTDPFHASYIQSLPGLEPVEHWTFSFEVGQLKPGRAMFETALSRFGVEASQALLIDDKPENVAGARALGMQGIPYQGYESTVDALRDAGLDGVGG